MFSVVAHAHHVGVVDKDVPSDEWSDSAEPHTKDEPKKHSCTVLSN